MRLALVLLFASAIVARAEENPGGRWEGLVQIPDRELPFIIDLAQSDGGAWTGSIILPGLGVKGAPLADITIKNPDVSFAFTGGRDFQAN